MRILRAKFVLPIERPPIENGSVAIDGETVVAVGPAAEIRRDHPGDVRDLGEAVLLPGLINAHCHLEYSGMLGQVPWRGIFIQWIEELLDRKRAESEADTVAAIRDGLGRLQRSGTTTVVNIETVPGLMDRLPESPLRIWRFLELIDFARHQSVPGLVAGAEKFIAGHPARRGGYGLSPHAPYTASAALYQEAATAARRNGWRLSTHLAESEEEADMFHRGYGPLCDYFRRAGRDMSDCKHGGTVQLLDRLGLLGSDWLAAHVNCVTQPEIEALARTGTHVVHCPKSHRFFRRPTPRIREFAARGINVCLGTDSLASNDTLDLFAEMRELTRLFPDLAPSEILAMATANPAKALNQADQLGRIGPGGRADLIAVPLEAGVVDPYEGAVYAEQPVAFIMIDGKELP